jgi:hypothetical protein
MPHYQAEAAERKRVLSGTRANTDGSQPEVPATLPEPAECGEAREKAAKVAGAKPRYVSDAVRLLRDASELFKQVESGEITIPQAVKKVAAHVDTTAPEQVGLTRTEFIAVLWDVVLAPKSRPGGPHRLSPAANNRSSPAPIRLGSWSVFWPKPMPERRKGRASS